MSIVTNEPLQNAAFKLPVAEYLLREFPRQEIYAIRTDTMRVKRVRDIDEARAFYDEVPPEVRGTPDYKEMLATAILAILLIVGVIMLRGGCVVYQAGDGEVEQMDP